ncbi:MAG TPA: hypothetical protein VGH46_06805 [Gaiellaceae bacterium]
MNVRTLVVVVVAALAVVPVAWSSSRAFTNCGIVTGGGARWSVTEAGGVSCRAAKPLVKKLAAKPHATVETQLGTYLGLKCVELAGKGKREIACVRKNGRGSVFGVTPPRR